MEKTTILEKEKEKKKGEVKVEETETSAVVEVGKKKEEPKVEAKTGLGAWIMGSEFFNFMKNSFLLAFQAMSSVQDQTLKILNTFLDQGVAFQQEGKKILGEWMNTFKKATHDYQKMVEVNLDRLASFFK